MVFYRYIKYGHLVLAFFKCFQGIEVYKVGKHKYNNVYFIF
jgi:hypothetical protein